MLETDLKEDRAPAAQLKVVLLPRHPDDHIADAAPGIEAVVESSELGLARLKRQ
jgi:hypothetical protein